MKNQSLGKEDLLCSTETKQLTFKFMLEAVQMGAEAYQSAHGGRRRVAGGFFFPPVTHIYSLHVVVLTLHLLSSIPPPHLFSVVVFVWNNNCRPKAGGVFCLE